MSFEEQRETLVAALKAAGVAEVLINKDDIPKSLPAAIVSIDREVGKNGTSRRYVDTDISWTVYLVVNAALGASDPDGALYDLKELFRVQYREMMYRDIPEIEYYSSRLDGARLVRVARMSLYKAGEGAGS